MKTQMRFQKIICLVMLILGAVALLYACSYLTGAMADLFTCLDKDDVLGYIIDTETNVTGADLYIEIQSFNDMLLWFSIVMILAAVLLYITSTQKRRKYYVSNYVATGVCAGVDIVLSIIAIAMNADWRHRFLTEVDFERWYYCYTATGTKRGEEYRLYAGVEYSDSTLMFDLGFVLFAIIIVASLALIFNLVWKKMNEKQEHKLLSGAAVSNSAEVSAL